MAKKFSDFSQLKRSMIGAPKRDEVKPEPVAAGNDNGDDVLAYFSKGSKGSSVGGKVKTAAPVIRDDRVAVLEEELAVKDEALAELAAEKAATDEKVSGLEKELQKSNDALVLERREVIRLKAEIAALRQEMQETDAKEAAGVSETEREAEPQEIEKPVRGLLAPISGVEEIFPGELRETVVSSLAESRDNAEQAGRERRAMLLMKLLASNAPSGELDRRRDGLRQILKDAGSFTDSTTIAALEKFGFKLISGRKHWKLEYGNVRIPLPKTPSDYRSLRNSASDIANKCF